MPDPAIGRALGGCLAAALAFAAFDAAAQAMYKWVDEKGVTHFSEQPPPDAKATKVTPKVTPPSNPGSYNPDAWKAQEGEAKKRTVQRRKDGDLEDRQRAVRASNCGTARNRLATLQESNEVIRYNDKGEKVFLSEKERNEQIAHAKDLVKEWCD